MKNLSERLAHVLRITGTRQTDLARAIGVKQQTIQNLCTGSIQSSRFTFEIAAVLGLNTRWLATGDGEVFLADDPKYKLFKDFSEVPLFDLSSLPELSDSRPISWIPFKTKQKNVFAIKMNDSSMSGIFPKGATLFIKEISNKSELKNGGYALFYINEFSESFVRKVNISNTKTTMEPTNTEFFKVIDLNESISFLGIVIACHFNTEENLDA